MMAELKPCPFCGCQMKIASGRYANGDKQIQPYGWHFDDCPLDHVLWCFDVEDGWTEETIAEAWNRREGGQDNGTN